MSGVEGGPAILVLRSLTPDRRDATWHDYSRSWRNPQASGEDYHEATGVHHLSLRRGDVAACGASAAAGDAVIGSPTRLGAGRRDGARTARTTDSILVFDLEGSPST
jgi:hypothetical protein